jgi:hypothetical protein
MTEMVFQVEEDPDGGLTARAVGESIFVEADTIDELREEIRDAVTCHFPTPDDRPKMIRLHVVHDEVITL